MKHKIYSVAKTQCGILFGGKSWDDAMILWLGLVYKWKSICRKFTVVRNEINILGKYGLFNKRSPAQLSHNHKKLPRNKTLHTQADLHKMI